MKTDNVWFNFNEGMGLTRKENRLFYLAMECSPCF